MGADKACREIVQSSIRELEAVFSQQCLVVLLAQYIWKKSQWQFSNFVCAANWSWCPANFLFRAWRGWHGSKLAGWGLLTATNR